MELKQLKTFSVIAKTESFSKASIILGYAQPTVTTHIQMLESELNVKLFERLGHTIKLTSQGERLLYYSDNILKFSSEAIADISLNNSIAQKISIGANESFSIARLPLVFNNFLKHYPNIDINLKFGAVNEINKWLKDNTVDIAFFLTHEVISSELTVETLVTEQIAVVASPMHPFSARQGVDICDFDSQNLVITQKDCTFRIMIEDLIKQAPIKLHSLIETNNVQAIKELVISGLGIAILPLACVKNEVSQGLLIDIEWNGPNLPVCTQIAYHKNKWLSPTIINFLEEARNIL